MMLSVLIPTHEHVCYRLVADLHSQCEECDIDYEIIVLEDGGRDQVAHIANLKINELLHCRYERRANNVGRAAIRNSLADMSCGEWLLFIDSDAQVVRSDYVLRYVAAAREGHQLVCGGIIHRDTPPEPDKMLRWHYERDYERKVGRVSPQLRTFNFMVSRPLFMRVRFDESFRTYGWEDLLFGVMMREGGADVYGIDNPLLNDEIESSSRFLEKTRESLRTLHGHAALLERHTRVGRVAAECRKRHVDGLIRCVFRMGRYLMERNLMSRNPDLRLFAFYKLAYYLSLS